jgi:RNA polymerase sigma factor (sigma-70 family)
MTGDEAKQALADMRPSLLRVAARILRASGALHEDSVQDAYLKALRAIEAGNFPQEQSHLLAWFTKVVHNAAFDVLRGQSRRKDRALGEPDNQPADRQPGPLEQLIQREDADQIDRTLARLPGFLGQLPSKERLAVELRFQGMSNHEIALILHVPLGSISALFRSALQQLRCLLGGDMNG